MVDTQLLEDYIAKSGKTKSYLSNKMGITIQTLRKKSTNQYDFKMGEVDILCSEIGVKTVKERNLIFLSKKQTKCLRRKTMPRINAKKKQYKISDLTKYIIAEMYAQDISQQEMAQHLGITQSTLSYRLKNNAFSYGDLLTIFNVLGTDADTKVKLMTLQEERGE